MASTNLYDRFSSRVSGAGLALSQSWKRRPRRQFTRQIIKTTSWDDFDWKMARQDRDIDKAITDLYLGDLKNPDDRPGYLNAPELIRDIFMTFLKPVPMLHKKYEVIKDARLNGKFVEQLMALTDWERLHDQTATDALLSKMATGVVIEALQEMIRQHREAVKQANEDRQNSDSPDPNGPPGTGRSDSWDEESGKRTGGKGGGGGGGKDGGETPGHNKDDGGHSQTGEQDEPGDITDDADDADDAEPVPLPWENEAEMREQMRRELAEQAEREQTQGADKGEFEGQAGSGDGSDDDEAGEGEDDEQSQLDDAEREIADDWLERDYEETDWEQLYEGVDFGRHVNAALQKAFNQIDDLESARKGVGIDDEEWKMMDPTQRLAIAEKLNTPRMKAIADMVGRMKRFALSKQAQKIIDAPHEIFDVEMGPTDLRRVLRSEFAYLGHPTARIEFFRKYINGELLQYKERGHEDVGKGPMVVCIDNSGSMTGAPENWAKGVAEAIRRVAADQRRDVHIIYFETNRHRERFDFPNGQGPFEKVLTFLSVSAGGGTEFDGVLTEALAKCKTMFEDQGKGKADIVFITDGEARLDEKWIKDFVKERDEIGARIFGIYISAYDSTRSSACRLMERFCQSVIPVKALEVNDDATDFLFSMV